MTIADLPDIVYHGTVSVHSESLQSGIDVKRGYLSVDFGQGFYTTPNYDQAVSIAKGRTNQYNKQYKTDKGFPLLIKYSVNKELLTRFKGLIFSEPDNKWKEFVFNNRIIAYKRKGVDFSVSKYYNENGKYHYVYGDVADSNITEMVTDILSGQKHFGDFIDTLKSFSKKDYTQLSIHSDEAAKALTIIDVITIKEEVVVYG